MAIILPTPKDRSLIFSKTVNNDSVAELTKTLLDISTDDAYISKIYNVHDIAYKPQPIKIHIDSYGGSVYQGLGLLNIIKNCTTPIHTIVTGCAMSCGFLISISGHKRFAYQHSTFMYHQVASAEFGKLKDIEDGVIEIKRLQHIIEQHTISQTKIPIAKLTEVYNKKEDWYMDSKQALKLGVIDEII
jgi:ATP-dependent Clp protease protease subunit